MLSLPIAEIDYFLRYFRMKLIKRVCARICLLHVFFNHVTVTPLNTREYVYLI